MCSVDLIRSNNKLQSAQSSSIAYMDYLDSLTQQLWLQNLRSLQEMRLSGQRQRINYEKPLKSLEKNGQSMRGTELFMGLKQIYRLMMLLGERCNVGRYSLISTCQLGSIFSIRQLMIFYMVEKIQASSKLKFSSLMSTALNNLNGKSSRLNQVMKDLS